MEKRNTMLLTVVAIATLLVAVVGATFAYFTATGDTSGSSDVRVITSSEDIRDMEESKAVIPEFIKAGNLPPDLIIEALTSKSIPDLKHKVK